MTESELYQNHIKPELKKAGIFHFRVEHEHLPDIYTAKDGKVRWIELKVINSKSSTETIKPDWRIGQLAWIKNHAKIGGELTVLCLWYKNNIYFLEPKESYTKKELMEVLK